MREPEELAVELPALTMSALAWGPSDGPLALCLHGFPDSAWTWRYLGPELADRGWRVVAPFSRGYAPTGPAPDGDYRVGALMTDALDLCRALDADDRTVLVGHDWGAITAHGLAAHAPDAFTKVVTLAVPPIPAIAGTIRDRPRVFAGQALRSWYIGFNQLPALPERAFQPLVRLLWRRWSPGYDATEDLAHVLRALPDRAHRAAALRYYRHMVVPRNRSSAYDAAHADWQRSPRVPTLYLHGSDDGCMSPAYLSRAARHLPAGSAAEEVPGAGHFLHLERPEKVHDLVVAFLDL